MSDVITFDSTLSADAPIRRVGKVFECGVYPDKDFALSEAEADAAVAAFVPVPADYEHRGGPLDGQLGTLRRIWREGAALYGEAEIPAWLDPLLAETGRKLSLAWDRATKTIIGWGWVRSPRVTDAALMSAYATFAGARHSVTDQRAIQAAHDQLVQAGAMCPGPPKEARMSFVEKVQAWLSAGAPAEFNEDAAPVVPPPAPEATPEAVPDPRVAELEVAFAAEQARVATLEAERRQEQAVTFADGLVTAGRLPPALRDAALALYRQALTDDAATPAPVTFSDGTGTAHTGSRAALVLALFSALPAQALTREVLDSATVLPTTRPAPDTAARRHDLLKMTPLGQTAQRQNGKD